MSDSLEWNLIGLRLTCSVIRQEFEKFPLKRNERKCNGFDEDNKSNKNTGGSEISNRKGGNKNIKKL